MDSFGYLLIFTNFQFATCIQVKSYIEMQFTADICFILNIIHAEKFDVYFNLQFVVKGICIDCLDYHKAESTK